MQTIETPVLIAGGGPVGLCASVLLSHHGVPSLLVERQTHTSLYPKARLVNTRTMEIFRQYGLEQAVREISLPSEESRYAIWAHTLVGEERQRRAFDAVDPDLSGKVSPTVGCTTSQEILEPVLLAAIQQNNLGQVRFGCELTTFIQDEAGVSATLLDHEQGERMQVRAQYLIGADGAYSRVRELLGIPMIGPRGLGHTMNILFLADISHRVAGRSINLAFIQHPEAPGVLLASDGKRRWVFQAFYSPLAGQREEDFTQERCEDLVRTAVGVPELPVEILRAAPWTSSACVAEHFQKGRVFLAGDAAHEMTPAGGFGMNTGIHDIHNLAWKLATVLQGWAGPALLESYERERQPVDHWITEQTLQSLASIRRLGSKKPPTDTNMYEGRQEFFHEQGMIFAAAYESAAILSDGTDLPRVTNPVSDYIPSAHPGCRAPHVWLSRAEQRLSTLDLFGANFVLLAGQAGEAWTQAARQVALTQQLPLQSFTVGARGDLADPEANWAVVYGVEQEGAVLVRPDGHVAWRAKTSAQEPVVELSQVLSAVLGQKFTKAPWASA